MTAIAMWSGPRNISTALLRSWGARADTFVCDEPLYAHYLRMTGVDHPGREDIIAAYETDWRKVVDGLTGAVPDAKAIFYQKHMAHHLLPDIGRDWLPRLTNAFLIRDPREMLISLHKVTPNPGVADTGLPQQWEIYKLVGGESGAAPAVVDARDVLENPRGVLQSLCAALDVEFDVAMLSWEAGRRPTDGIWARHWYAAVEASTGFEPYRPRDEALPEELQPVLEECREYYQRLYAERLTAREPK